MTSPTSPRSTPSGLINTRVRSVTAHTLIDVFGRWPLAGQQTTLLPATDLGAQVDDQQPYPGEQHTDEADRGVHDGATDQNGLHSEVGPDRPSPSLQRRQH